MRVETSQLIPGCILSENIFGKTSHALIVKNTVLTKEHIDFLNHFFIDAVHISSKLEDGKIYNPAKGTIKKGGINPLSPDIKKTYEPFSDHYKNVVKSYQRIFNNWSNNTPIDMPALRKLLIPLIESIEKESIDVYHLHTYSKKDDYFYHHDVSVSIISAFLAKKMGYEKREWIQVGLAGFLSNSGMSKVDAHIIKEPRLLLHAENEQMKKHPVYSYRMIESIRTITDAVKLAVLQHHERLDGSGYPLALKKAQIHKYSRIIAVSDTYHAMTSERPYQQKQTQTPLEVITDLQENQTLKLDLKVIDVLASHYLN